MENHIEPVTKVELSEEHEVFQGYPKSQILDEEEDGPILTNQQLQSLRNDARI